MYYSYAKCDWGNDTVWGMRSPTVYFWPCCATLWRNSLRLSWKNCEDNFLCVEGEKRCPWTGSNWSSTRGLCIEEWCTRIWCLLLKCLYEQSLCSDSLNRAKPVLSRGLHCLHSSSLFSYIQSGEDSFLLFHHRVCCHSILIVYRTCSAAEIKLSIKRN